MLVGSIFAFNVSIVFCIYKQDYFKIECIKIYKENGFKDALLNAVMRGKEISITVSGCKYSIKLIEIH